MRDVHRGGGQPALQLRDLRAGLNSEFRVQIRQRLVHQKDLRLTDDGPAHGHALALPSRERLRLPIEVVLEVQELRGFEDACSDLLFAGFGELEREAHVLGDAHVRVERVVLEHHRDVAVLGFGMRDVRAADENATAVDLLEAGEHAQRCGLAAARRADENEKFAVGDLEVEGVDRGHLRAREKPGGAVERDRCHGYV